MTFEETTDQIEILNTSYRNGKIGRADYLKKHKAILYKYDKANRPMTFAERIRKEGITVSRSKKYVGWYEFKGKNITASLSQESCETTWWEVNLWDDDADQRVVDHFDSYNHFDTKGDVVYALYEFDKSLNK